MSLREKARAVKAKGEAQRGDFTPTGVPKRMYQYWWNEIPSKKRFRLSERTQNFCHFWRVVAIWAPLMFLRRKAKAFATNVITLTVVGIALVAAAIYALITVDDLFLGILSAIGILIAIAVGVNGFVSGVSMAMDPEDRNLYDMPPKAWALPSMIIALPFGLLGFVATKVVNNWNHNWNRRLLKALGVLAGLAAIALYSVAWAVNWSTTLDVTLWVMAGLALAALCIFTAVKLEAYIEGKRELEREARAELIASMTIEEYDEYRRAVSEPGRVYKFFRGIGDFIILIAQVVRVNKWKIC